MCMLIKKDSLTFFNGPFFSDVLYTYFQCVMDWKWMDTLIQLYHVFNTALFQVSDMVMDMFA